ncbi:response regulator [Bacteriovoracaceae bacterium]|nr:response regulator [Bacteriovoracaceae bacterium]
MENKILLIDDEPEVITLLVDVITENEISGQILTAYDPISALEIYNQHKNSITVIVCDQYMPTTKGTEFLKIVNNTTPWIKVVLYTGDEMLKTRPSEIPDFIDSVIYKMDPMEDLLKEISTGKDPKQHNRPSYQRKFPRFHADNLHYCFIQFESEIQSENQTALLLTRSDGGVSIATKLNSNIKQSSSVILWIGKISLDPINLAISQEGVIARTKGRVVWIQIIDSTAIKAGIEFESPFPF